MAAPNISELATVTIESRTRSLADNMSDNNALLMKMKEKGKVKTVSGGRTIYQELDYADNSTYTRFSGYQPLNVQPSEVFSAAEFDYKQASVAVTVSKLEELQNSGKEQMIELVSARVNNAENTFMNMLCADAYSDGTADGGKQIGGLASLVAASPSTGMVGGINRANHEFWRNIAESGATSGTIKTEMESLWVQLVRGNDKPDLIVAGNQMYTWFLTALQDQQRFTDARMANMGFTNVKFQTAPVVLDGGVGGNCPTDVMYFLNCNYIHWRPHAQANMVPLDPDRYATNPGLAKPRW